MEKISVIVPIYNVEKYLNRCIDSILNQTYRNLEIILVDDGSTDRSSEICLARSKEDTRIKVFRKKNGGLSDARNYGLDRSCGKYVFFIDSDDYIATDCIMRLYRNLKNTESDISTILFYPFNENEIPFSKMGTNRAYDNEKALEQLLYRRRCTTSAWGKLYDARLFDGIRYPVGKICEDLPTTYKIFAKAKKIAIDDSKLYYYLQRKDSIIRSEFKPDRFEALKFANEETAFVKKNFPKLIKAALNREFMESVYVLRSIFSSSNVSSNFLKGATDVYQDLRWGVVFDFKATIESRIYALIGVRGIKILERRRSV